MDALGYVFSAIGSAIGGVLQVLVDFLNLIIEVLPNPDPFPALVESVAVEPSGFTATAFYWLDCFVGVDFGVGVITAWATLMVGSVVFAAVYWVVKTIKP